VKHVANSGIPFGVYIHWPFCAQKCPYCDFNSHVRHGGWDEDRFTAAYKRELDHIAGFTGRRTVSSIFFGGGTPSLMKPQTTAAILDHIATLWSVAPDAEITLEANPGSVEAERFAGYRAAGVNRVSMGLQSLRDDQLKKLGRIHTVAEAKAAFEIARNTFNRFSFDLIYARPGQTTADWRAELSEALSFSVQHLSLYQLTIEPDTPYAVLHARGKLTVPDQDIALELYAITQQMMRGARLPAWRYGEYAGVGPGAHGRLDFDGARHATSTERNPERWADRVLCDGHGFVECSALSLAEQADEMLLMGLRLSEGLDLDKLRARTGFQPSRGAISDLQSMGVLEVVQGPSSSIGYGLDDIKSCMGPGLTPSGHTSEHEQPARIRAAGSGRFVLNELVLRLSQSFEPALPAPAAPHSAP
jgi:coproporphyrinogen III oxidase-like Fe-S oxidoreductase